jgi:hypothetical protein
MSSTILMCHRENWYASFEVKTCSRINDMGIPPETLILYVLLVRIIVSLKQSKNTR